MSKIPSLYTLGYEQRTVAEFVSMLKDAGVGVLVDVRETPWSHKPGFSKRALAEHLAAEGIEYVHAGFAGNPKRLRDRAETGADALALYAAHLSARPGIVDQLDRLVLTCHRQGKRVCLTCLERRPEDCHRSILADHWKRKGRRAVRHLT
jgi:uncharacterized protein (DUF488 family)